MFYHHRIDLRIDFCGAGDRLVEQFPAADLLVPDQFGKSHPIMAAIFLEGHFDPRGDESMMPAASPAKAGSHQSTS
jgi:hypothetical protein